jgi:hypothetical protein
MEKIAIGNIWGIDIYENETLFMMGYGECKVHKNEGTVATYIGVHAMDDSFRNNLFHNGNEWSGEGTSVLYFDNPEIVGFEQARVRKVLSKKWYRFTLEHGLETVNHVNFDELEYLVTIDGVENIIDVIDDGVYTCYISVDGLFIDYCMLGNDIDAMEKQLLEMFRCL